MALVAACTRESRCTTSRIHQHTQKNSVPLKEVLTQRCESARHALVGNITMRSQNDAKRARKIADANIDIARNHCAAATSTLHHSSGRCAIDVVAAPQ